MRASKKFHAAQPIVYPSLLEKQINTASRNLMTIRKSRGADSLYASLLRLRSGQASASACPRAPQATLSLGRGDLGCGMILSDCRLGLEEIRFDCLCCQMRCGSLVRRRRIICRSQVGGHTGPPLRCLQTAFSHRHFVRRGFILG